MVLLKFWSNDDGTIRLDGLFMKDITNDERSKMIDRSSLINRKHRVAKNVYMAESSLFMKMAGKLNTMKIYALHMREGENTVIIVPPKSCVFLDGHTISPASFSILGNVNVAEALRSLMKSPVEHG